MSSHMPEGVASPIVKGITELAEKFHDTNREGCSSSPTTFLKKAASLCRLAGLPVNRIRAGFTPFFPHPPKMPAPVGLRFRLSIPVDTTDGRALQHSSTSMWTSILPINDCSNWNMISYHDISNDHLPYSTPYWPIPRRLYDDWRDLLPHAQRSHPIWGLHFHLYNKCLANSMPFNSLSELLPSAFDITSSEPFYGQTLDRVDLRIQVHRTRSTPENINRTLRSDSMRYRYVLEREWYNWSCRDSKPFATPFSGAHAFIGIGSNMGDRLRFIESACNLMEDKGIHVVRTSAVYETAPMYLTDQAEFLNAVILVSRRMSQLSVVIFNILGAHRCTALFTAASPERHRIYLGQSEGHRQRSSSY